LQDVANHQIRHLRGLLIEDAINFQQRYHIHRLSFNRLDVRRARHWFNKERGQSTSPIAESDKLSTFTSALLRSLLSSSPRSNLPETFQLDNERLRAVKADLHRSIYTEICCDVFDMLGSKTVNWESRESAKSTLRSSLADIVGDAKRFTDNIGNIAVELVRLLLQVEGSPNPSDPNLVELAETRLRADLHINSETFLTLSGALFDKQLPVLYDAVKAHLRLTPMTLHEIMVPTATLPAPFGLPVKEKLAIEQPNLDDIFKRLAHIAVLHWHIWSPIVYNLPAEEPSPLSSHSIDDSESDAASQGTTTDSDIDDQESLGIHSVSSTPSPSPVDPGSDIQVFLNGQFTGENEQPE